ncbi:MAG: hypothetical protein J5714_02655 [Alphaproteobacteria bacterium]|nr:hypothetical protein [Alphaproteobacteria bacterium]
MKGLLTFLSCYEMIAIWCLYDMDAEAFQYIVVCLFIPVILAILFMWQKEIVTFFKRLWYVLTHQPNAQKRNS